LKSSLAILRCSCLILYHFNCFDQNTFQNQLFLFLPRDAARVCLVNGKPKRNKTNSEEEEEEEEEEEDEEDEEE